MAEQVAELLAKARRQLHQRADWLDDEIKRLTVEREIVHAQSSWMSYWKYEASRDQFEHEAGHTISGAAFRQDGTAWPFMQMWHELKRERAASIPPLSNTERP